MISTFCFFCPALGNYLCHIEQVDLEEEAKSGACDLVGSPAKGIAQFTEHRQTISLGLQLEEKNTGGQRGNAVRLVHQTLNMGKL